MEEMTIWEQYTVTLNKDSKVGFGFAISGGRDKPSPDSGDAIVISDVVRNGPAEGRLHIRDQVVMVNGVALDNVTSGFTIQHLKTCGKTANITVKRPRKMQLPASSRPTRSASYSNLLSDAQPASRGHRRVSDTGSDHYDRRRRYSRDSSPDRNGHALPLMSGFKRLPRQEGPSTPIKATLLKKKLTDEYGLKLGSQIFIKHMTDSGLAAREGTLQEGDLVLKINGMTTENLSLLETKHLVEKSRGKLTMLVLRDDRKFLVSIPEVEDSAPNSEEERRESSSELEDISDLDSDHRRDRIPRSGTRERRTRRHHRTEASLPAKSRDSPSVHSTLTRPSSHSQPPRRAPSESESDRSPSPRPSRRSRTPDQRDNRSKYGTLSGIPLPDPRASPVTRSLDSWAPNRPASTASRPRKAVSESDSDRSASPPRRRDSPKSDTHSRYRVLPDLPPAGLRASPIPLRDSGRRGPSPMRPRDDSETESDESTGPPRRVGTPGQDSRSRYSGTAEPPPQSPSVEPPRWKTPSGRYSRQEREPSQSESEGSNESPPRRVSSSRRDSRGSAERIRVLPDLRSTPQPLKQDSPRRGTTPVRPPSDESTESDDVPSRPRRHGSGEFERDHDSPRSYSHSVNGTLRSTASHSSRHAAPPPPVEEPLYSIPP